MQEGTYYNNGVEVQTNLYHTALEEDDAFGSDDVIDFAKYGITGAITSGVLGFVNTGAAFANALGADVDRLDTGDVLEDLGLTGSADYYSRNAGVVDAVGFGLSAIVPGALGVKLARGTQALVGARAAAAAKGGNMGFFSKATTGLSKALVPKNQAAALRQTIKTENLVKTKIPFVTRAAREGFHQAAVESVFAESVILATMNQNPTLDGNDVGYFEAIGENLGNAGFGFVIGTGIGGGVAATVGYRNLRGIFREEELAKNQMFKTFTPTSTETKINIAEGSNIANLAHGREKLRGIIEQAEEGAVEFTPARKSEALARIAQIEDEIFDNIADLTKSQLTGNKPDGELVKTLRSMVNDMDDEAIADTFANLKHVGRYTESDVMFDPPAFDFKIVENDDWTDTIQKAIFGKEYKAGDAAQRARAGSAITGDSMTRGMNVQGRRADGSAVNDVYLLKEALDNMDKDEAISLLRHEIGHATTDRITQLITMDKFNIYSQMEELSRMRRPSQWAIVDQLPEAQKSLKKAVESGDEDLIEFFSNKVKRLEKTKQYMGSVEEVMADAWAMFNTPELTGKLAYKYREAYQLMHANNTIKSMVGRSEALVDVRTKNMYGLTDRFPTVADLGKPTIVGKSVKYANGITKINPEKFSVLKTNPTEASAHYYHAAKVAPKKNITFEWDNFYKMNQVLHHAKKNDWSGNVTIKSNGEQITFNISPENASELKALEDTYIGFKKRALAELHKKERKHSLAYASRVLDVDEAFVEGKELLGQESIPFWSQTYDVDKPTVMKFFYEGRDQILSPEGYKEMAQVQAEAKAIMQSTVAQVDDYFYQFDDKISEIFPLPAHERGFNPAIEYTAADNGTGFVTTFQGAEDYYGDSKSFIQGVANGNSTLKAKGEEFIETTVGPNAKRVMENPEALAEAASLDSLLRQRQYKFSGILEEDTIDSYLERFIDAERVRPSKAKANIQALKSNTTLAAALEKYRGRGSIISKELEEILDHAINAKTLRGTIIQRVENNVKHGMNKIRNSDLVDFWESKIEANKIIVQGKRVRNAVRGYESTLDEDILYPGALNRERFSNMLFVVPTKKGIFARQKPSIIAANDAQGLASKRAQVERIYGDDVKILSKESFERYYKNMDDFDVDRKLVDYNMNSDLQNNGIAWDAVPEPTPDLMIDYVTEMRKDFTRTVDNLTAARFSEEFATLDSYAKKAEVLESSAGKKISKNNTFREAQNIMLNRNTNEKFGAWTDAQAKIDAALSTVSSTLRSMVVTAENTGDFETMAKYMEQYNLPKVYNDQVGEFMVRSHKVSKAQMKELMPRANALSSTFMLRLDMAQQLVNAFSTPITLLPEIKHIIKSLPELRKQQLLQGLEVAFPDGSGNKMPSNMKLLQQAIKDFFTNKELVKEYDRMGLMPSIIREIRDSVDDLAIDPAVIAKHGSKGWLGKAQKVVDILSKPADFSEEFVKFIAARSTDLVLEAGGITSKSMRRMAMLTAVKRVHGNYQYAQRPAMFKGFAGQAIGLFQTYQFNLFQQLLRHIGDKNVTAASSMLGLQAGIFGVQSVPGFQLMNDYIAQKSQDGQDFYTGVGTIARTESETFGSLSDWILYGVSSNFTKPLVGEGIALFTRGDLTPRTPILVPTSPSEVPTISMATKFFSSLMTAGKAIGEGEAAGQILAEALMKNGLNRPLANVGEMLAGGKVTSKGSLVSATADMDTWGAFTRLMGVKPLNDAIAINSFYRARGHQTLRRERLNSAGETAKRIIRSGSWDNDEYKRFMEKYVESGGNIENYQSWIHNQAMGATNSVIHDMYKSNTSIEGRYLQTLMGGDIDEYVGVRYDL